MTKAHLIPSFIMKILPSIKCHINNVLSRLGFVFIRKPNPYKFIKEFGIPLSLIVDVGVADGTPLLWQLADSNTNLVLIDPTLTSKDIHKFRRMVKCSLEYFPVIASDIDHSELYLKLNGRKTSVTHDDCDSIPFMGMRLDTLLNSSSGFLRKKSSASILKIDVEGHEFSVINGTLKLITTFDFLLIEIGVFFHNGEDFQNLIDTLYSFNFTLFGCHDAPMNSNGLNGTFDLFLVNKSSYYFQILANGMALFK